MSKNKIHIVHLSSADIWRGAEQQIINLYDGLNLQGYQQTIICSKNGLLAQYCLKNQYSIQTYYRESGINWNLVQQMKSLNKIKKIDFIHIHDPHAHHAYLLLYILGTKIPSILHRRVDFPTAQNMFSAWKYKIDGIKKIVCVSERVKNIFSVNKELYDKCEVVYDCIKTEDFQKINGRKILEKDYPVLKDKFIVANIAALVDHKDYPTFIKAAYHLVKVLQIKDLHFLIVGQGEKETEIRKMVDEYQLQSFITFTGHRKDIPQILNGIDVYTFTSKMEGFGSTILEVMASKVPIVATNTGGPAEILSHKVDALIVPVKDYVAIAHQIAQLKSDKNLGATLVNAAYQKVQKFSINSYIHRMENIYHQIL